MKIPSSMLKSVVEYFNIFRRPSMAEIVEQELRKHTELVHNAKSVIQAHKFQQHMAEANITALCEWHLQNSKSNL